MAKVAGVVRVVLNGVDWGTKQGATLETGGSTKTSQFASGKRTGSSKEPVSSKITVTLEATTDLDIEALKNFEGQAEYITDNGIHYVAPESETMEPPKLNDNGGGVEITIEGNEAVPV